MSDNYRIALFNRTVMMNVGNPPTPKVDLPTPEWLNPEWKSKRPSGVFYFGNPPIKTKWAITTYNDPAIQSEVMRLVTFKTCAFCKTSMYEFPKDFQSGIVLLCDSCGYWGGRGTIDWGAGAYNNRGILGRYSPLAGYDDIPSDLLLRDLRRKPKGMSKLSPKKAEEFVMDLIKETLNCEVRLIGGVKDSGVDGYIIRNDKIRSLVQVKWHYNSDRAEAIRVVREVAGTLLARRVPSAIIVSSRSHFSKEAKIEADEISGTHVDTVGKLSIELKSYNDILDMLEIASRQINERIPREKLLNLKDGNCIFG